MGRQPCCSKEEGLNRGAWTAMEDKILSDYIKVHGEGKWHRLPKKAGLKRCGKSCRLRWLNYLRPDIKRGNITNDEEDLIIRLHKLLGNRWSLIAGRLPGRTDNEIKNYWNTKIGKKLQNQQNIASSTHRLSKPNDTSQRSVARAHPTVVNAETNVIRTKASRCNKVVTPLELQTIDQQLLSDPTPIVAQPASMVHASMDDKSLSESSSHKLITSEKEDASDLMLDLEIDEQHLSDFLITDFSQLISDMDNEAASETNICDQGHLSPISDKSLLFSEDKLRDSDFPWMTSSIDSEFDWLQD